MRTNERLADFIRAEIEPILQDWEAFARTVFHANHMSKSGLRDHAREMLLEIADDLYSCQSSLQQAEKSKGHGPVEEEESWAEVHGSERHNSGFSVMETVSEFRALRASVVSHWTRSNSTVSGQQLEDMTRFHEAVDQAVAESLEHYATAKEMETRLFEAILVSSPDPIFVLDLEGRFIYANKATLELFTQDLKGVVGKSTFDLKLPFASEYQRNLEKVVMERCPYRGNFKHTFAVGQGECFEYLLAPVLDGEENTEATVCIFRDITERTHAEERIWHAAHHDLLTGLPNRRLILDRLDQEVKHAKRSNLPLSVLFMDLDGFKEVNDSLGHEAGDRLLADVAGRLIECVREDDTVARLGGDEFTVILTGAKQREDVEYVAQTIINELAKPFYLEQNPVSISVSIGISFYPMDAPTPVALLEAADKAMYIAKKSGSNRMCFYESPG